MEEPTTYTRKMKRAAKILAYKRHRQPGLKGWELKRALGGDYLQIIGSLNQQLDLLGLQVKTVFDSEQTQDLTEEQYEKARFYITIKEPLHTSDVVMSGWRVDDIAVLVATVALIISKQGKIQRTELDQILREKFSNRRIDSSLHHFIKLGYLSQDDAGNLYLDWRTRAEIDPKVLLKLIMSEEKKKSSQESS